MIFRDVKVNLNFPLLVHLFSLIEIFRKIPCESSANDKKQERDLHKEYSTPILDL